MVDPEDPDLFAHRPISGSPNGVRTRVSTLRGPWSPPDSNCARLP